MMTKEEVNTGEEARWQAVLDCDADFDGLFVYGVRSTGVYCRPSCTSRKPKRENVTFFPISEIAEQAGFRACKRCEPHLPYLEDPRIEMVRVVCRRIAESDDGIPALSELAEGVDVSPHHLQRVFKEVVGVSPRQYADACRLGTLKESLRDGGSVTESLYEAGYGSSSRLYEKASSQLGMTPAHYRRNGEGAQIRFAVAECYLGWLLVAVTDRGICTVSLGDDEKALEASLRREYRAANIERDGEALRDWVEAVLEVVSSNKPHKELPLDVRATAFERMVWEELRRIPYGETRSYSEVAEAIGRPKAARAVAKACAANPAAVVIPCHRVVRRDGGVGGYKWGVERKKALLAQEGSHSSRASYSTNAKPD